MLFMCTSSTVYQFKDKTHIGIKNNLEEPGAGRQPLDLTPLHYSLLCTSLKIKPIGIRRTRLITWGVHMRLGLPRCFQSKTVTTASFVLHTILYTHIL